MVGPRRDFAILHYYLGQKTLLIGNFVVGVALISLNSILAHK